MRLIFKLSAKALLVLMAVEQVEVVVAIRITFLFLLLSISLLGQEKKKLPPPEVQLIYSYYMQDGDHSAVEGGIGTQELDYHGPSIVVHIPTDSISTISVNAGVDVYSSASTDRIDFIASSASSKDARSHINVGYSRNNPERERGFGTHGSFSIESDYTSYGLGGYYNQGWNNYNSSLTITGQLYIDDCRWGRLSLDPESELQLIYPEELRGIDWETEYMRYTSTLAVGFTRVINKRTNIGFFIDGVWQSGLLATTFHRIYFSDTSFHAIEKLPYQRLKLPISMRLNYFAFKQLLVRFYYRFYTDSWGLNAHSIEVEPVYKICPFFSIFPFYRLHVQNEVFWFNPYREHSITQDFYTSDYDLSAFTAHKFGLGINWRPLNGFTKTNYGWKSMEFRIGGYLRSDGLQSLFLSSVFSISD